MIKATDIRRGQVVKIDGNIFVVVQMDHVTPGKGHAHVQTKMKNLNSGKISPMRFNSSDQIDNVFVDRQEMEFLYNDERHAVFMNTETYEQLELPTDQVQEQLKFLLPNNICVVSFFDGKPLTIDLPTTVTLKVVDAPPAVRGDTATNVTKEVTTETGLMVKTPHYIESGNKIKIDTRTGDFVERVRD